MLYYDKISVYKGIVINNTRESKEGDIFNYWCLLGKGFRFEPDVWIGCHVVLMMCMKLRDITILNIHGYDYRCIISGISKSKAIKSR